MTRLRALVVLPTRDLVTQVREVFETTGKGRGLKVPTFVTKTNGWFSLVLRLELPLANTPFHMSRLNS